MVQTNALWKSGGRNQHESKATDEADCAHSRPEPGDAPSMLQVLTKCPFRQQY